MGTYVEINIEQASRRWRFHTDAHDVLELVRALSQHGINALLSNR